MKRESDGRFARVEHLGTATCVECGLIDDVDQLTLCGNCSQAVHVNGLCAGACPFCSVLICQLCIDTSATGGWHACISAFALTAVPS